MNDSTPIQLCFPFYAETESKPERAAPAELMAVAVYVARTLGSRYAAFIQRVNGHLGRLEAQGAA